MANVYLAYEVFLFCGSVLMVTQRGIHTCELSVREAVGGPPSPSPAYRSGMGWNVTMSAWYHLAHELSQPSSCSHTEVFEELGCCEGMLLITIGMRRSYNIRNVVPDADSL